MDFECYLFPWTSLDERFFRWMACRGELWTKVHGLYFSASCICNGISLGQFLPKSPQVSLYRTTLGRLHVDSHYEYNSHSPGRAPIGISLPIHFRRPDSTKLSPSLCASLEPLDTYSDIFMEKNTARKRLGTLKTAILKAKQSLS